ncbi:PhaM family polyhydroxyalkanoate granule multifunctional regulatory protein [Trinickia dinghuensis]|uniref:Transcriptional regulator n=1 Tax=Trinickia dinghuensis TaxID=2291023 RepID=A0A3D8K421_9BURK|nr:PhaM family polyhydroxyalkanoate granule multifunctional regulatory protein [Trinickia dinghuensis]RDU99969.1 transcriptional regulator [Trinickia dinghuensis]
MTDTAGGNPPFPGFPGFPPAEMLDKMWDMMRLTPFGTAFPGMQPGSAQGFGAPLAAMSDMMAPLMNVEELDKRITDLRAVEQWLKLNLNMLQSAIQALEVQRSTLSTLRAFGAFAQASMTQPASDAAPASTSSPWGTSTSSASARSGSTSGTSDKGAGESDRAQKADDAQADAQASAAFDPSGWWNLLQSQFNQLAAFAMTQPGAAGGEADAKPDTSKKAGADGTQGAKDAGEPAASASKPAAKRAPARKSAAKRAPESGGGAARGEK